MSNIPRVIVAAATCAINLLCWTGAAAALDYPPVSCSARAAYVGPPLHAPVGIPTPSLGAEGSFDAPTIAALEKAFATAGDATAAPAMTAAVLVPGRGIWTARKGPQAAPLLFWASAGKTLIATVVLQLVGEGRLSLDDHVSKWVPGIPNGDVVTVRDLLAHTSGLFSANEDLVVHARRPMLSLAEEIKVLVRHGAMFCPGARWRYSNSNYTLLGEIIRQVDGRSYAEAITKRIVEPLGLTKMRVLTAGNPNADMAPLVSAKERPIEPIWAGAAGPVAASADDMVSFWRALLAGKLVRSTELNAMFDLLYPMFDPGTFYGLGTMVFEVPDGAGTTRWLGHAGGTPGAGAVVFYSPSDAAFVAVALTGDGSAAATANLLLRQIRKP